MPIYTRTGDDGTTGLFGNRRVPKHHARIEAYGTVDELNSFVGLLRAEPIAPPLGERLQEVQDMLFEIGADLATEGGKASLPRIEPAIAALERWIDESEASLPQLTSFVLPGGTRAAALLHIVRTVARRAERRYWTLVDSLVADQSEPPPKEIGVYLNRMSDLCFTWARRVNADANVSDTPWHQGGRAGS